MAYSSSLLVALISLFMLHTSAFVSAQNAPRRNTQTRTQQPDITYTVSMPKPHTHLLAVEMRVKLNANSSAAKDRRKETAQD